MFLKTLFLHGFKSFANETHLEFYPGVTGLIGPNGCGKSTVVDAIRWVLGENAADVLRISETTDVIFSGTHQRKPMDMAEVTATFADCDAALNRADDEIVITRRIYRDGHSVYLNNGNTCDQQEIQGLLKNARIGFINTSIISPGQIVRLWNSTPDDLPVLLAEAAGVTGLKQQDQDTRKRYLATFSKVRVNFKEMIKHLFGERALADLVVTNEGAPLESAIEILTDPIGTRLQCISRLIGGERMLTALALLFSINMVKPSPFCVLDDLDYPLDESNSGRYIRMLGKLSEIYQLIIVTHSKRTMALADILYGITMEEFGVTKIVGMRLAQPGGPNG